MDGIFSNKQLADSQLNVARMNNITELLPSYLKSHLNEKKDTDNLDKIRCDSNNNSIRAVPSPKDASSAEKIGRGNTVACIWYDEFAFLKYNKKVFDAAAFAYSKASEAAERNGSPHSRIITTTPNMLDVLEGAYCYSLIQSAIKFDEAWYAMDKEEVYRIVDKGSKNGFVHIQYSWEELGLSKEWYEKQCKLVNYDLLTIRREILLEWTLSGDGSLFSEEQLDELHNNVNKPIGQFYIDNTYRFLVYEKLVNINTRSYIISVDIAGGLEADNTVITIIDPLTYKPVASFKSNNIDTVELTDLLVKLIENLFQNSVIVPERNNMG